MLAKEMTWMALVCVLEGVELKDCSVLSLSLSVSSILGSGVNRPKKDPRCQGVPHPYLLFKKSERKKLLERGYGIPESEQSQQLQKKLLILPFPAWGVYSSDPGCKKNPSLKINVCKKIPLYTSPKHYIMFIITDS